VGQGKCRSGFDAILSRKHWWLQRSQWHQDEVLQPPQFGCRAVECSCHKNPTAPVHPKGVALHAAIGALETLGEPLGCKRKINCLRCGAVERIIPPFSHALVAAFKATVPGLRSNRNHEYITLSSQATEWTKDENVDKGKKTANEVYLNHFPSEPLLYTVYNMYII